MRRIDLYLGRETLRGTLLILGALAAIDTLIDFASELADIDARYRFADVAAYTVLKLPPRLVEFLPAATLIGAIMSLGDLAARSELVALRAAGYSKRRIVFSTLIAGGALALATAAVGEWLAPPAEARAAALKGETAAYARYGFGVWFKDGERFVYADTADDRRYFFGVELYEFDAGGALRRVIEADAMEARAGHLVLRAAREARLDAEPPTFAEHDELLLARARAAAPRERLPAHMGALELARHIAAARAAGLPAPRHEFALWQRLSHPLSILAMLVLAMPFVFAPMRDAGAGRRLFFGALLGLACFVFARSAIDIGLIYALPAWLGALAPLGVIFGAGLWLLGRHP